MEKQFVADLAVQTRVQAVFVVREQAMVPFRNKPGKFLNLTLGDRSGEIKGRAWDNAEQLAERAAVGDVVLVTGRVEEYQGQLQLIVADLVAAAPDSFDPDDLLPRSSRSREELLAALAATVAEVSNPHLRALLDLFLGDEEFCGRLVEAFGAKSLHHSYVGGLLEHTLSVVEILKCVAQLHPELDRDLLVAGGLLHDIGKLEELGGAVAVDYTDLGHFVGHTVLGDRMVTARIAQLKGFPEPMANLLSHMLLSHHGEREWGAPVVPATMEASALHYADNLDARVQGFKQVIAANRGGGANWSEYHRSYQRAIYLGPGREPATDAAPGEQTAGQLRF